MAVTDILVTPARIWYAPVGEALPDETTIEYGDDWGGDWVDLGYTLTPVSLATATEEFKLYVEQTTAPVKVRRTQEDLTIETTLAEFTPQNLVLAFDGSTTPTAAGSGQRAFDLIKAGGKVNVSEYAWGLEGVYQDALNAEFPIRIFLHRGSATLNGNIEFAKAAGVGIPLRISALPDTTLPAGEQLLVIHRITAEATA